MRKKMSVFLAALCALAIGAALVTLQSSAHAAATQSTRSVYLTMYGWPDNDPAGSDAIAYPRSDGYPTVHDHAAGTGTYADPVTVAVAVGYLPPGTRAYVTAYRKYVMVEDECATCKGAWLDMWVGGKGLDPTYVLQREDALTLDSTRVVVNPPAGLPVDTTPMLDPSVKPGPDNPPTPGPSPTATTPTPSPTPTSPGVPGRASVARIVVHGSTVAFMWKGVSGATRYRVQILSSSGKVEHHGPSSQTWVVSYLKPHVPRYFRVAAGNGNGWGAWSPSVKFTG